MHEQLDGVLQHGRARGRSGASPAPAMLPEKIEREHGAPRAGGGMTVRR
jgi:hypothetical protein